MKASFVRLFVALLAIVLVAGCKEKKEEKVILTPKSSTAPVKTETIAMEPTEAVTDVKWRGSEYKINIKSAADKSLRTAEDENGQKYYDNRIVLTITGPDGSQFLKKEFVKDDFKEYVSKEFFETKALVGLVYDKVDGGNICFAASVGSPDKFSDDYIPFEVTISSSGNISVELCEQNLVDDVSHEENE